jgi:arsenate reductase (thioredoxin)
MSFDRRRSPAADRSMWSISMRVALFGLALAFSTGSLCAENASEPVHVVFVCEHGSVKSLIAMVYFNARAHERGLPYQAVARGTAPEPVVPRPVREGLRVSGFDVSGFVPQLFKASDLDGASLVVSFDQDINETVGGRVPHLRWDNLPGVLADYARGRDEIVRHVDSLLDTLSRRAAR